MADAAVEFLLDNLKQLLVYNANLISSVKDQVESLCHDLRLLAAFVKDTTESRSKHAVVKELMRRIRIEVYKAEDIVDMYVFHASVRKTRTNFVKAQVHLSDYSMKLQSVGKEIQDIRGRVKEIYGNKLFASEVFNKTDFEIPLYKIKQRLVDYAHFNSGVIDGVDSLCNDLRLLVAFVEETTESQSIHEVVEELSRQIRIEVHKAEDIVDWFHALVTNSSTREFFSLHLITVGKEIQDIRVRVKEIYDNKLFASEVSNKTETFIRYSPSVEEKNVVGFDKEVEQVVGWLKADKDELEVLSVVGMGGLGKTTLVKKVYNNSAVQYEFFIRSWVYVSQVYSTRDVFLKILFDVTRENKDMSQWSVNMIADELRKRLKDGKYLIVLDDIWTRKAWDDLKTVFPNTKNGSRILITSRNKDVAIHANTSLPPYQLQFLTDDESWELLEKKVFPKGTRCSRELENLGKQIARKCYGLPLAIVVISGILKKQDKSPSAWEKVEEKVNTYVAMEPEQCMEVLASSYNHLPYYLKACFLYFSVFPKDYEIPVWKMIHIWVAEGFIQRIGDVSPEEMAEENLHDLVDRNLVLVERRKANGGIKTCRIHGMLHVMCVKQAEEENFFKEIKVGEQSIYKSVDPNVFRRVYVHSRVLDYVSSRPDSSHIRSFLCYGQEETVLRPELISYFPGTFSLLRVLDVLPISFTRFPSIQLVHLRYIALLGTFEVLPAAITNLWNLQTLILETSSLRIEVKADLWTLLQLRHVYTSAASILPAPSSSSRKGGKGKDPLVNKNLRTMSKVSPSSCTDVILARTPNLQKLGVRGNLASLLEEKKGICKFDNITKLSHLEKLKLLNNTNPISPLDGKLRVLPDWYKFPPKLKKLTLSDTMLDWEQMSVIGKLLSLEVLKLGDNAFVGARWVTPDGGFVQLRVLQIGKTDLVHWEAIAHQFPQLQRVCLKHCEQLVAVPSGLGDITTLEVMELSWTSRLAITSARLIQKKFKLLVFPPDQETQT